jgi:hypothetical protein
MVVPVCTSALKGARVCAINGVSGIRKWRRIQTVYIMQGNRREPNGIRKITTANRNARVAVADKLNEVRRRITVLRSRMLATEDLIRKQMGRDQDCTDTSLRLMALRTKMLELIADRDSLGGSEPLLNVEQRLKAEHPVAKQSKATGRS